MHIFLTMYKIVKQIASMSQDSLMSSRKSQKCTVQHGIQINNIQDEEVKDGQSDEQHLQGSPLNEFLELLNENHDSNEMDPSFVDFSCLRRKGKHGCGYECLSKLSVSEMPCSFINTEIDPPTQQIQMQISEMVDKPMEEMDAEMSTKKISFRCSSQKQHDGRKISKTFSRVPHHLCWLKPVGLSKVF